MEDVIQLLGPYCDTSSSLALAMTCREGAAHFNNRRTRFRHAKRSFRGRPEISRGVCAHHACSYIRSEILFMDGHGRRVRHEYTSMYCPRHKMIYGAGTM